MTFCSRSKFGKSAVAALVVGALAVTLGMPETSSAHHSTAMFTWGDGARLDNLTVDRWVWTNPHTFIYARDAAGNRWAFEGMSPNHLSREGWSRRTLTAGEKISLVYYPLRDGRHGGFAVTVIKEDGSSISQLPQR